MKRNQPEARALFSHASYARAAVAALVLAAAVTGAWPACGTDEPASAAPDFDPGPSFGAEVTVRIVGRGRVTTSGGEVDCPGTCFKRLLVDDPKGDAALQGSMLFAEPTSGARFTGYTFETVELGTRARGPAHCSPMTRTTESPSVRAGSSIIPLRFGELKGTPPKGRESECADFTAVPLAYAVTATFENEPVPVFDSGVGPELPPLFAPNNAIVGAGKEIGLSDSRVYWRVAQSNGQSVVASGFTAGGPASVLAGPFAMTSFLFDQNVVFQLQSTGAIQSIQGDDTFARLVTGSAPTCTALASDRFRVYCRTTFSAGSTLYSWPLFGGAPTTVYQLPAGNALAVNEPTESIYYSEQPSAGSAAVKNAARNGGGDGGAPQFPTTVAFGQSFPRNLVSGPSHLFWLDDRGGITAAVAASKFSFDGTPSVGSAGMYVRVVAADPFLSDTYWIGISPPGAGASSIVRANVDNVPPARVFRDGITGLGGIAVDATYVYWTQSDGRVYRLPKFEE